MMRYLLLLISIITFSVAKADFVDVATISINGEMVRKLTNNSRVTYLLNFNKFEIGDTVKVKIWTDHGFQDNAIVILQNLESKHIDTLNNRNEFLLTKELLEQEHLISVIFYYRRHSEVIAVPWEICKIVPNNRIELVHETINQLRDFLLKINAKSGNSSASILNDSVSINFNGVKTKGGDILRQQTDSIWLEKSQIATNLMLDNIELSYIRRFNSIDYVQLYDLSSKIYGSISVTENSIDNFTVAFGDFTYKLTFHFSFYDEVYRVHQISYSKK